MILFMDSPDQDRKVSLEHHLAELGLEQPELFSGRELNEIIRLTVDMKEATKGRTGVYKDCSHYLGRIQQRVVLNEAQLFVVVRYITGILGV